MSRYRDLSLTMIFKRHTALLLMEMLEDRAYQAPLPRSLRRLAEQLVTDFAIKKRYLAIWPEPEMQP